MPDVQLLGRKGPEGDQMNHALFLVLAGLQVIGPLFYDKRPSVRRFNKSATGARWPHIGHIPGLGHLPLRILSAETPANFATRSRIVPLGFGCRPVHRWIDLLLAPR
jgi:hypothetical protein